MDKIKRWETKMMMRLFRFKREGRDMGRIPYKMLQRSQEDLDKDGFIPFCTKLLLKACGELWDGCVIRDPMLSSLP